MSLFDTLTHVTRQLPGCRATSIVSLESGLPLASVTGDGTDASGADAFTSDVYRQIRSTLEELDASGPVEQLVLQGKRSTFISIPLQDGEHFWHVITESKTTLGFTQAVLRKNLEDVQRSVEELFG